MGAGVQESTPISEQVSLLEYVGLAGDFSHLNINDPFHVRKMGSTYQTEIRAGLTTFLAMAYTIPVNSGMLSIVIPDRKEQLICAISLSAVCGCLLMGMMSNYPFMLAPGMGTNAFFTFGICIGQGLPWQSALAAVFTAACIFLLLSVTGLRTMMIRLFPAGVKSAIGAGIGAFLTLIAFESSEGMGIVKADEATLITLNTVNASNYDAAKIWLSVLIFCVTAACYVAKIPGSPLIGIIFGTIVTWIEGWANGVEHSVLAYPFGTNGDRSVDGFHIYLPDALFATPSLSGLFGEVFEGFHAAVDPSMASAFWTGVLTLCYSDLLDASGTFFAVAKAAGLTDKRGNLPLAKQNMAYIADALAALMGSIFGVSTVATYAESTVASADGAKTGLASIVTGFCFVLAIPFAPIVSAIPPLATGPILCLVGGLMFKELKDVEWEDAEEALPAFLCVLMMPFTFSIGYGIIGGVLVWFALQLLLIPNRLRKGVDPFIRFKKLWLSAREESGCAEIEVATLQSEGASKTDKIAPHIEEVQV